MGTNLDNDTLAKALFGDVRRAVLTSLFLSPDEPLYVREIIRRSGVGQGGVQRELQNLAGAGLLLRERRGNLVYYRVNTAAPVYPELRSLILKTTGLTSVLQGSLAGMADGIDLAFVYGSIASGVSTAGSDVDLLVVGEADGMLLHETMMRAERVLHRPVNYTLISLGEYRDRLASDDAFITRITNGPRLPIIGEVVDV